MLTEIGTLVTIVKGLVDIAKSGGGFFGNSKKGTTDAVVQLKERVAGLAEQLQQSVALSKMLPLWLKEHSRFDLFAESLDDEEVRLLDSRLRDLISDSIHDHFSGTFFRTNFNCLPNVDDAIKDFQERLLVLEHQLTGIPTGSAQAWRLSWPILKVRMSDLRLEAVKINNMADRIHSSLIDELRKAGA